MKEKTRENNQDALNADIAKLREEIERHPLLGGIAAFGLGFWIATLLFRRSKGVSMHF